MSAATGAPRPGATVREPLVSVLPPNAPRSGEGALLRGFARSVLWLGRWKLVGDWPDLRKVVVIVAPHSSVWDAIWGIAAKVAMGLGIVFIGKKEAFWGPLGWILRRVGGIPVDRAAPGGIVQQVASEMHRAERMWFVLAPEGTRRRVEHWKPGFWKIARAAGVPVFTVGFDYPTRRIMMGQLVELTDDFDADLRRIRPLFARYRGKHHDV